MLNGMIIQVLLAYIKALGQYKGLGFLNIFQYDTIITRFSKEVRDYGANNYN